MQSYKKVVPVPQCARGCIIGKGGSMIRRIFEATGTRVQMNDDGAHLIGTGYGITKAEEMIIDIITKRVRLQENKTTMSIPSGMNGYIIGRKGSRIKQIIEESGASVKVEDMKVIIQGSDEQRAKAQTLINEALKMAEEDPFQGAVKVCVPEKFAGLVIGSGGGNLRKIKDETGTAITYRNENFLIKGEDKLQVDKAVLRIKREIGFKIRLRNENESGNMKITYVDGSDLSEDNMFKLEMVDPDKYKLILIEKPLSEVSSCLDEHLRSSLLEVLCKVAKEKEEAHDDLIVDMWSHFGRSLIKGVDAAEEDDTFDLKQVQEKFRVIEKGSRASFPKVTWWSEFSAGGIEKLEVEQLERHLSKRPFNAPPNMRFDFSFLTPSCHQIRFKAFSPKHNEGDEAGGGLEFFDHAPVTMKNVLEHHVTQDGKANFYLCAPYCRWAKLDIIIPSRPFDCRFILRTSRAILDKTPEQEEEIMILIGYLTDNLICEDGKLKLSRDSALPEGFHLDYWRQCDRRSYPYSCSGEDYTVMISEEIAEDKNRWEGVETEKTDIHLHCDAWDRKLLEGDWEPGEIVSKLPAFLGFVRSVQQNVFVSEQEAEEN